MEGPFNFPSPTERQGSSLCTASYGDWNVGGQLTTTTRTLTNPRYGDLPDALVTLNADYQLPAYSQVVWNATQRSRFGKSFQVYLFNAGGVSITISAGDNWSVANFMLTAGTGCLLLVIDNGISATGVPMSPSSAAGGFNTSTVGPITATNPVALGGTLVLTNTALDSIATNNWKAGSLSSIGGQNSVAVGHLANVVTNDGVAIGYQAQAYARGVAVGLGTVGNTDGVSIGNSAISSNAYTVLIGSSTSATADRAIAIGYQASVSATSAIAIGYQTSAVFPNVILIGNAASCDVTVTSGGIAIGAGAETNGGVALGENAYGGLGNTSVGRGAETRYANATAIGEDADTRTSCTSLGYNARSLFDYSAAIGSNIATIAPYTTLIGNADQPDPTVHVVTSTGFMRSIKQYVAKFRSEIQVSNWIDNPRVKLDIIEMWDIPGAFSISGGNQIVLPSFTDNDYQVWQLVVVYEGLMNSTGDHMNTGVIYHLNFDMFYDDGTPQLLGRIEDLSCTSWCNPQTQVIYFRRTAGATSEVLYFYYYSSQAQIFGDVLTYVKADYYVWRVV